MASLEELLALVEEPLATLEEPLATLLARRASDSVSTERVFCKRKVGGALAQAR